MKKIEFDINVIALVALTDAGKEALTFFLKRFPHGAPDDLKLAGGKMLQKPLWQIMHIFGNSFGAGKGSLFVGDTIQIAVPNDGSCRYIEETDISEFVRTL